MFKFKRLKQDIRGAAAVEFALIIPVLSIVLLGVIDYGMVALEKMEMMSATRAGAQLAIADYSDTDAIKDIVVASTNLSISTSDVTTTQFCECAGVTTDCSDTCSGSVVKEYYMTVSATEQFTPLFISSDITVSGSTTVRVQ